MRKKKKIEDTKVRSWFDISDENFIRILDTNYKPGNSYNFKLVVSASNRLNFLHSLAY